MKQGKQKQILANACH